MEKLTLNNENYFSEEASRIYTGSSEIKSFLKCESETLAKLNGEWIEEPSKALIQSSYIDAYFSDEMVEFELSHPDIFSSRGATKGQLKSEYSELNNIIAQAENDPMFMKYLNGEHQTIMTGEISDVSVKIKIDSYFKDKLIVDLKAIKDLKLIWNDELNCKQNFINYYDYILQGALYQEIVYQNTGKKIPFVIAVMTKEKYSERALLQLPQDELDAKLEEIKNILPRIKLLKEGKLEPNSCGHCDYCKSKKKVTGLYDYNTYFSMRGGI